MGADSLAAVAGPSLRVDVLSLFPDALSGFLSVSVIGRAIRRGIVSISSRSIRDWAEGKHSVVDDRPFGGGAGMVLKPEPICSAIDQLRGERSCAIYLCPDGAKLDGALAKELAGREHLILLCGHYDGVDERVRESRIDMEISIGDYVLTNGILPAAVLIDAVCRHIPGVLSNGQSLVQDSFNGNLLTFPQYTRPKVFDGMEVPEILMSGNHKNIDGWRRERQLERTRSRRMDLLEEFGNEPGN
ncbi:MAG: tRNA (guanosine(37)-N1)-methyltransferase TrmD [Puniceicoccales bacterium]|jgi:tRNA (guanine37-N1)-methyltransferase|nr:tRNA (guanosine(37)-N1)-methyltransferase TrmD [Puniceicoccales bacterium]